MNFELAYSYLFSIVLICLGVCLFLTVLKSIIGPRISDRIVSINMIGTLVTSCIAILSVFLVDETYLIDVCLIYVLISFLSVVVFTSIYINTYRIKKNNEKKEDK